MPRVPRPRPLGGLHRHGALFGLRHAHSPWLVLLVLVVLVVVVLAVRSRR